MAPLEDSLHFIEVHGKAERDELQHQIQDVASMLDGVSSGQRALEIDFEGRLTLEQDVRRGNAAASPGIASGKLGVHMLEDDSENLMSRQEAARKFEP